MYYRSQGYRYPREVRVPSNYGGSVFSEPIGEQISEEQGRLLTDAQETNVNVEEKSEKATEAPASLFKSLNPSSLFGGKIGSEELLILAVILLISDGDGSSDIIWLLLLLLFVK